MDYETFKATLKEMTPEEREIAIILYLKDIKDLLQSFLESQGTILKHY